MRKRGFLSLTLSSTLIILLLTVLILISSCDNKNNNENNNKNYDDFAKCLSEKGVTMYGTQQCHYCQQQKELFGESFKYINYIDCYYQYDKCEEADVKYTPTWIINGKIYTGLQSLEKLAELSGCQI